MSKICQIILSADVSQGNKSLRLHIYSIFSRCRGTTKWVHQACIQRWVDEKQNGNTNAKVECPQCGFSYSIQFPQPGFVVAILDSGDMLIKKLCPIITGGACVGSIYWTMVTFGAVTFMDTVGHERGVEIMESTDTMVLLVSLPLVPVGLIIGQMIRWEETVIIKSYREAKVWILEFFC